MKASPARSQPSVSMAYPLLLLDVVAERGVEPAQVLQAAGLTADALQRPGARMSPAQYTLLTLHAARLTGDPGLGCELGLRMRPSAHGLLGYAVMTCGTLRESIELTLRYGRIRQRNIAMRFHLEGSGARAQAVIELHEVQPIGPARHFFLEGMLIGLMRSVQGLLGMQDDAVAFRELGLELCFDFAQPVHFARYAARLPAVRFKQPTTQLRMSARWLDQALVMADKPASRQAVEQCERELALLGDDEAGPDWVARVCAELDEALTGTAPTLPSLDALAEHLCLSGRTLKRKLQARGTSYQSLIDDVRQRKALHLLSQTQLELQTVATLLGYQDPANFTRAFKRWTGLSPSVYRQSMRSSVT